MKGAETFLPLYKLFHMALPTLHQVDNYALPELLAPRVSKEHGYTKKQGQDLVREAKRMLYLHAVTRKPVSPSLHVDMAWHEMLMFTKFYKEFAKFITVFVHHNPTPGPPDGGKTYEATKKLYEETFKKNLIRNTGRKKTPFGAFFTIE
ncbi:MAG: hypothetical protein COU27_02930 [Candidatus Levybacteria bacterium CG10_big_fil_rev_8_21_14_0_10_36_7]|nr:MAG: hypothetical protein COU27_02930 [Candidatus Levybacteria bacterium CG10_big_fil_rev_8_21_14_0_10_36_7]